MMKNTDGIKEDLLGLLDQWRLDINACSMAYGTEDYVRMVNRFRNDLVNIKDGVPLKDITDEYYDEVLFPIGQEQMIRWKVLHKQDAQSDAEIEAKESEITVELAKKLFNFIIQQLVTKIGFDRFNIGGLEQ